VKAGDTRDEVTRPVIKATLPEALKEREKIRRASLVELTRRMDFHEPFVGGVGKCRNVRR